MLTASQLARRFGLSRTALLYYESVGLIRAAGRTQANYRRYGDAEIRRLEQICLYRSAGLSLGDIVRVLDGPATDVSRILDRRLAEIHAEIERLRDNQNSILKLLRVKDSLERTESMTKDRFVAVLKAAGLGQEEMNRFHIEFERAAPQDHQEFLEFLQIPEAEIRLIRDQSRVR